MTDKQKNLIEAMNEFCTNKCPLDATTQEASKYISENLWEYKLEMEAMSGRYGY